MPSTELANIWSFNDEGESMELILEPRADSEDKLELYLGCVIKEGKNGTDFRGDNIHLDVDDVELLVLAGQKWLDSLKEAK